MRRKEMRLESWVGLNTYCISGRNLCTKNIVAMLRRADLTDFSGPFFTPSRDCIPVRLHDPIGPFALEPSVILGQLAVDIVRLRPGKLLTGTLFTHRCSRNGGTCCRPTTCLYSTRPVLALSTTIECSIDAGQEPVSTSSQSEWPHLTAGCGRESDVPECLKGVHS